MIDHWYLFPCGDKETGAYNFENASWLSALSFFLLYHSLLPLDMPIKLLIAKTLYTYSILENDVEMIDEDQSELDNQVVGCSVKNVAVLEDLSRVSHIFCDKTGTLTKNELIFKSIAVGDNKLELTSDMKAYGNEVR